MIEMCAFAVQTQQLRFLQYEVLWYDGRALSHLHSVFASVMYQCEHRRRRVIVLHVYRLWLPSCMQVDKRELSLQHFRIKLRSPKAIIPRSYVRLSASGSRRCALRRSDNKWLTCHIIEYGIPSLIYKHPDPPCSRCYNIARLSFGLVGCIACFLPPHSH